LTQKAKTLSLSAIATFKSGGTPRKSNGEYWGGDFPWVSAKDLKSSVIVESIDHLSSAGFAASSVAPVDSLLILVRGMTLHKDVPVCLAGRDVAFNQDIKALIVSKEILPKYLLYFLKSQKNMLLTLVDSAGHGTGRLNTDSLKAFPVLIPSLPEQIVLADLLSTWDTAIEKTEKLISAKQEQRKGLMQQLLSGKQRFPGFSKPWQQVRLGEVFSNRTESGRTDLPLVSITSSEGVVFRDGLKRKDTSSSNKGKYLRICPGDIGYNTMRMWQGVNGLSQIEGIVSPAYTVVTPDDSLVPEFMALLFKFPPIVHLFYRYSQGLVSDTWNLKFRHFSEIHVRVPEMQEQEAIAAIFQPVDKELSLLHQQLVAFKEQKQGLMQKLLTGEWWVNYGEDS